MSTAPLKRPHRVQFAIKRALDPVVALVLLVLLSPVLAALTVWIVLDSGRPVLFRQQRAGRNGTPFRMYKFRTMVPDAIALGREMQISDDPFGIVHDDPRITRAGKFMRRTSLDELPQLVNVLKGQMSLIGPRPDLVEQAAHYTDADQRRLAVPPGITGWSQVKGRDEIPWPVRIEQDVWYIEHFSLWLDLKIAVLTLAQPFRDEPDPIEDTMNIERSRDPQ